MISFLLLFSFCIYIQHSSFNVFVFHYQGFDFICVLSSSSSSKLLTQLVSWSSVHLLLLFVTLIKLTFVFVAAFGLFLWFVWQWYCLRQWWLWLFGKLILLWHWLCSLCWPLLWPWSCFVCLSYLWFRFTFIYCSFSWPWFGFILLVLFMVLIVFTSWSFLWPWSHSFTPLLNYLFWV